MVKIDGFQEVRQRVDLNSESIVNIIMDFEEERVVKAPTDFSGESLEVVDITDLSKTYPPAIIEKLKSANKEIQNRNSRRLSHSWKRLFARCRTSIRPTDFLA